MKITHITTLDGDTLVEWWEEEGFRGRVGQIMTEGTITVIPIPDICVLCDFCSTEIEEFPVPVVESYALCKKCLKSIQI